MRPQNAHPYTYVMTWETWDSEVGSVAMRPFIYAYIEALRPFRLINVSRAAFGGPPAGAVAIVFHVAGAFGCFLANQHDKWIPCNERSSCL